ncbi:MAG: hypothetical protein QXL94_08305 [Candidatus Parvarchaeum sp.]
MNSINDTMIAKCLKCHHTIIYSVNHEWLHAKTTKNKDSLSGQVCWCGCTSALGRVVNVVG